MGLFPDFFPLKLAEIRRQGRISGDEPCVDDGVIDKLLQTNDPSERELLTALSISEHISECRGQYDSSLMVAW